jgi:hypothetical protein
VVTSANPIAAFARSRNVQVLIACVAIAIVLSETAVRSLSREGERPPPSAAIDRVPAPAVKTASLSLQASSRDRTATSQPRSESSCKSFEFSFFNPSCSDERITSRRGGSIESPPSYRVTLTHLNRHELVTHHTHHSQRMSKELLPRISPMQEAQQNR